jgi:hypothetical protein
MAPLGAVFSSIGQASGASYMMAKSSLVHYSMTVSFFLKTILPSCRTDTSKRKAMPDCQTQEDSQLQFMPSTHLLGRLPAARASELKMSGPVVTCTVDHGGVLMMQPLSLNALSKVTGTSLRRVLHIVFGPRELPYGYFGNR